MHHIRRFGRVVDDAVLYYTKNDKLLDACELTAIEPTVDLTSSIWQGDEFILIPTSCDYIEFYVVLLKDSGTLSTFLT